MAYIEISAVKNLNDNYHVCVDIHNPGFSSDSHIVMTREELKEFRNMLHNTLIELNLELNYEA